MILAIDMGSTFFKAAVFDPALKMIGTGHALLSYRFDKGGIAEFAVAHAEEQFRAAIGEALTESKIKTSDIRAIGITSQAQTFTVASGKGSSKLPFVSWQDVRAQEVGCLAQLDFAGHSSFSECLPGLLISKLLHFQTLEKQRFFQSDDHVFLLPTWFLWKLTGKSVIDRNLAAMSGLYSLISNGWWPDALEQCGLSPENLPSLVSLAAVAAETTSAAEEWGLPPGIPVVLAGNDQTAGACGADLHINRGILITLGTAQVAYRCLDVLPPPMDNCVRGPYLDKRFYQLVADDGGGSVIDWAETVLAGGNRDETFFDAAAKAPPGCEGLVFEPEIGAGKGCWRGIGRHHKTTHLARSVVESLVARMVGMVQRFSIDVKTVPVLVAGGGSQYSLWVDNIFD